MNRFVELLVFCALGLLTTVSGAAAELKQLIVNGQVRTFLLERPAGQGPNPTIIMLHGGADGAEREAQISRLAQLGPQQGFVAVFPEGRGRRWNFFPPGRETPQVVQFFHEYGGLPDDVAFLKMLVADLVQGGISDPKRIYLSGRSLGGVMALRMACDDVGSFAAIGLLISAMPDTIGSHCHPPKPLPVLMINGTGDRVLPYGGERGVRGDILWSARRLVDFFRQLNDCAETPQQYILPGRNTHDIVIEHSTTCSGGPVILYRVVEGGHDVPAALNATQALLDFFHGRTR